MKRVLLVGLLVAAATVTVPAPAQAAGCTGGTGVTVVVQYGDGPTEVGCAPGDPSSGYDALEDAGFSITYAQGNGAGAVCRLNGYPSANNCGSMPPADAYWAYFHGEPGGAWTYSNVGGGAYNPKPGTVEGWRFAGNADTPPDLPPPANPVKPTAAPTKKPTTKASPRPGSSGSVGTPTTGPSASSTPSPTVSATATASVGATDDPTLDPSGDPTLAPTSGPTVVAVDEPGSLPDGDSKRGGLSWIWGVVLIGGLAAAGGATALARRRG